MIWRHGVQQQLRMRASSAAAFALLLISVAVLAVGTGLWTMSGENMRNYDAAFTTIGLVRQTSDNIKISEFWDAGLKQYIPYGEITADTFLPESVLDFEGANYIIPPKQRPCYWTDWSGYIVRRQDETVKAHWLNANGEIAIFEPVENGVPSEPMRVNIVEHLWGDSTPADYRWLCDHYTEHPGMLQAGKQYIAWWNNGPFWHPTRTKANQSAGSESILNPPLNGEQFTRQGVLFPAEPHLDTNWEEVTEGFFTSKAWLEWKSLMEAYDRVTNTVLVLPVERTKLFLPFYQEEAPLREGRDITDQEYDAGEPVCLLPYKLAQRNKLKVGDTVELPLYLADYRYEPSKVFIPGNGMMDGGSAIPYTLLNAKQEPYPVFERSTYKIVGVYTPKGGQSMLTTGLELPDNGIIVPQKSIKNSDENNIAAVGPMQPGTTSFQIPNGTIRQYMERFNKLGIPNLEITFYDGGYEQLKAGMDDVKRMGTLLAVSGAGAAVATVLFFVLLSVQKQKGRTAVERSLGVTKNQCRLSLLSGLLSVTLPSVTLGGMAGYLGTDKVFTQVNHTVSETFSTAFSNWVNHANVTKNVVLSGTSPIVALWVALAVTLFILLVSLAAIQKNLQAEPLEVLSQRDS